MPKIAGVWIESYGDVIISGVKKRAIDRVLKKLKEPLKFQGLVVREINGWHISSYQFSSFFKSDIVAPSGYVAMSYTSGVKSEVEAFVHSYLKSKGILS